MPLGLQSLHGSLNAVDTDQSCRQTEATSCGALTEGDKMDIILNHVIAIL